MGPEQKSVSCEPNQNSSGSRRAGELPPPPRPFIFMHFSVKIMPLIDEHPPLDLAPPLPIPGNPESPTDKKLNNYYRSNSLAESCKISLPTKKL